MKNIGLKLKDKREENGLSIEEVAEDLKMRPSQISSIEEGKTEDFKDVFYLKYFIRDYAKYLGLDSERILDEFNEYLFDMTSKIPIELIKEAKKDKNEKSYSTHLFSCIFILYRFFCSCRIIVKRYIGYTRSCCHRDKNESE